LENAHLDYRGTDFKSVPLVSKEVCHSALFFICPLGRLERIDLLRHFFDFDLEMGGCGTFSDPPFAGRIRINAAVFARRALDHLAATFALVDDDIAGAPVESAAFLHHEAALDSFFNRLTNHGSLLFPLPVAELPNSKSLLKKARLQAVQKCPDARPSKS
jgi:hypothetical protein